MRIFQIQNALKFEPQRGKMKIVYESWTFLYEILTGIVKKKN